VLTAGAIMAECSTVLGTETEDGTGLHTEQDIRDAAPATVAADTPIVELFTPCSHSTAPVAVTGEGDALIGVVPRGRLLAVLGELDAPDPAPGGAAVPAPGTAEGKVAAGA
jgi:glycine betaine/proline transport system ATP-binding protein